MTSFENSKFQIIKKREDVDKYKNEPSLICQNMVAIFTTKEKKSFFFFSIFSTPPNSKTCLIILINNIFYLSVKLITFFFIAMINLFLNDIIQNIFLDF